MTANCKTYISHNQTKAQRGPQALKQFWPHVDTQTRNTVPKTGTADLECL